MDTDEYISRKERREQQRQQDQSGQSRSRLFRRVMVWGGTILVIAGLGWGIVTLSNNVQLPSQGGSLVVPVSSTDHIRGVASASITLVEYGDFQCPACSAFEPLVEQLFKEPTLQPKLRLIFRNFPLTQIHQNAQLASQAAEAAALQGKFWEMHDRIYSTQARWSQMSDKGARDVFAQYAQELGLNAAQFAKDIDSSAVKDRIAADVAGANQAGVDSTPTFFVNGVKMQQPESYDQFKQYVSNGVTATP